MAGGAGYVPGGVPRRRPGNLKRNNRPVGEHQPSSGGAGYDPNHPTPKPPHKPPKPGAPGAPTMPPPGFYDPGLLSQLGASDRGLSDLLSDISRANERSATDYGISKANMRLALRWNAADAGLGIGRARQDFGIGQQQRTEDYSSSLGGLFRQYSNLGQQQDQSAREAGVEQGGALAQAMARRAVNYAIEKHPLDVSYARANQDARRGLQRYTFDTRTTLGRAKRTEATQEHEALLNYERGVTDRGFQRSRATRENRFLKTDVARTAWTEAKAAGYLPALGNGGWGTPAAPNPPNPPSPKRPRKPRGNAKPAGLGTATSAY